MVFTTVDLLGLSRQDLEWHQMFFRALLAFIAAIVFIRLAGMRSFGRQSAFDVVLSITLGAVLSRAITGHYPFFPTLSTALLLALLHRIVAWLSYQSKAFNKLTQGDPVLLYKDGQKIQKNLMKHSITEQDITQALHEENIDNHTTVKSMWLEPDGKISIVKK